MHGRPTCREGGRHESIITGFGCILLFYYYQLTKIVPTYVYIYTCGHNGTIKFVCGHNGTADTTGRTSRSVLSACGHNGTMKIHRGHNGTADTTGRTSCSVLSACGQNGTIKFVCGHNGTADTTGRNRVIPKTILKMVQTASLHGTQSVRVGVWQCSPTV